MKRFADHASLRQWILNSIVIFFGGFVVAQDIAIGTWRTHFSYTDARHLVVTSDKIFCSTATGLFSRELFTGTIRKLSKIDGLSDVGVSALAYDDVNNALVIGYESGFVDYIFENEILSISDIATTNLEGDKSINDIAFGSGRTFLATDLGVVVTDSDNAEIIENYVQIGTGGIAVEVSQIIVRNDSLFVRTNEGIQSGRLDANLLDFENWSRYPGSSGYTDLALVGGEIYVVSGSELLRFSSGGWIDTGFDLPAGADALFSVDGSLMTAVDGNIFTLDPSGFGTFVTSSATSINDIISSGGGTLFIADAANGLQTLAGDLLSPDGPLTDYFSNFRVIANELYGFHAPSPFSYDGSLQIESFSKFTEGLWQQVTLPGFTNVSDVARFNSNFYYSSIGDGIFMETSESILTDIPGSSSSLDTMITSLGSSERLWLTSFRNDNPVHIMNADQSWTSFSSTFTGEDEYLTVDLSETGIGWLGASSGVITVLEPMEVQLDQISTSDGLPSSFIDIDISIEDNAWVGTLSGPALFADASFIFSDSQGIRPTFENRTLFDGEQINAVMTDGGNRIWFGTNQGLWVYDENTSRQVAVFNESNSPLPSDRIIQLAYNGSNGEVFIYTDRGMVSYRSASSIGNRDHRNVNIFPNPVRPEYQGTVGLTGLARNVNIKITDVNGNLVKEINANGGSASWDLTDVRGGQISTGIYLFFSSSSDGEETYVGKIAVVR